jgi:type VI protein secretion system component VasK
VTFLAATAEAAGAIPWPQLGAGGLLAATVLMILTGRLVPRSVSDKWEAAYHEERQLNREQAEQLAELTEMGHTTVALLKSITSESGRPAKQGKT